MHCFRFAQLKKKYKTVSIQAHNKIKQEIDFEDIFQQEQSYLSGFRHCQKKKCWNVQKTRKKATCTSTGICIRFILIRSSHPSRDSPIVIWPLRLRYTSVSCSAWILNHHWLCVSSSWDLTVVHCSLSPL